MAEPGIGNVQIRQPVPQPFRSTVNVFLPVGVHAPVKQHGVVGNVKFVQRGAPLHQCLKRGQGTFGKTIFRQHQTHHGRRLGHAFANPFGRAVVQSVFGQIQRRQMLVVDEHSGQTMAEREFGGFFRGFDFARRVRRAIV